MNTFWFQAVLISGIALGVFLLINGLIPRSPKQPSKRLSAEITGASLVAIGSLIRAWDSDGWLAVLLWTICLVCVFAVIQKSVAFRKTKHEDARPGLHS